MFCWIILELEVIFYAKFMAFIVGGKILNEFMLALLHYLFKGHFLFSFVLIEKYLTDVKQLL